MIASWLENIEAAVVPVLQADADLADACGTIEAGMYVPGLEQDLLGADFPYLGVTAIGFDQDTQETAGVSVHQVEVSCSVACIGTPMIDVKNSIQRIIARINALVGRESIGGRFSLRDDVGEISTVQVGSGQLLSADRNAEDASFRLTGEYKFNIEYRLSLTGMAAGE